MTPCVCVIDTGYLVELFKVPGHFRENAFEEINSRLRKAIENKYRLYVPLPCIFELGNLIVTSSSGNYRQKASDNLYEMVSSCIRDNTPWIITPSPSIDSLIYLADDFKKNYAKQAIGLTDIFVIKEAQRLGKKYHGMGYKVHIWTTDSHVKTLEPDQETNAFL